jgi:hypothetical protein
MDELKIRNELLGPILGLDFYDYTNPNLLEKIKSVISVHASQERIEAVLKLLKTAKNCDGYIELKDGMVVNHKRIIWSHNQFLCSEIGIVGLTHEETIEIKDMEEEILSKKSATILQCDSKNTVENCEQIVQRYNLFGFVTDKAGDVIIGLKNFESGNIQFRDYKSLELLAKKLKNDKNKLKVVIDENTPSGKEFIRRLQINKIDSKLFQIEQSEGEYYGVRKNSGKILEPHMMVGVRSSDLSISMAENFIEFDRIPHGDIVFLDKRYSKKSLLEPYLLSIREQQKTFNNTDPKVLFRLLTSDSE